jgi:hypothetical protein
METVLDHLLGTDRVSSVLFTQFLRPLRANSIGLGIAYDCVQAFSGTVRIGLIKEELVDLVHSTASCKPQTAFQVDMGMPLPTPLSLFSLKCLHQVWVTPALLQVFWKEYN